MGRRDRSTSPSSTSSAICAQAPAGSRAGRNLLSAGADAYQHPEHERDRRRQPMTSPWCPRARRRTADVPSGSAARCVGYEAVRRSDRHVRRRGEWRAQPGTGAGRIGFVLGLTALILLVVGFYGTMTAAVVGAGANSGSGWPSGHPVGCDTLVVRPLPPRRRSRPRDRPAMKSFARLLFGVRPMEPAVTSVTTARRRDPRDRRRARPGTPRRACQSGYSAASGVGSRLRAQARP